MKEKNSERFFFIVGSGRCGTTLLRAILDARDDVAIPGETHFYTTYKIQNSLRYRNMSPRLYRKAISEYPQWRHVRNENVNWALFQDLARKKSPGWSSIFSSFLEAYRLSGNKRYVGEKTPGHIRRLALLSNVYPAAKFIHVVRDPRAVCASYQNHDLYFNVHGRSVVHAASKWREAAKAHRLAARIMTKNSYLLLRYEDLLTNPHEVLAKVCDFLQIPRDEGMIERYLGRNVSVTNRNNHRGIGQPLFKSSMEAWRSQLSEKERLVVEWIVGNEMEVFGYQRDSRFGVIDFIRFFPLVMASRVRFYMYAARKLFLRG